MLATDIGQRLSPRLRHRLEEVARAHVPAEAGAPQDAGAVETVGVAGVEGEMGGVGTAGEAGGFGGVEAEATGEPVSEVRRVREITEDTLRERIKDAGDRLIITMRSLAPPSSSRPAAPVTLALFAINLIIYLALLYKGRLDDGYALVRSGANFHAAVRAGEWWRLVTALFLHETQDPFHLHLIFNMTTLYLFGRHVEPLVGSVRYAVFYLAAGIAGNALSLVMHQAAFGAGMSPGFSIGASGAVFGLVGAFIVTLVERRGEWPEHWRRALLVNLIVLSVLQVAFGRIIPRLDNWAHIGGAFGGALAALLIGPGGMLEERRWGRLVTIVAAVGLGGMLVWAGISVVRTPLEATLAKVPDHELVVGPVRMMVPEYVTRETPEQPDWPGQEAVLDKVATLGVAPHVVPAEPGGVMATLRRCAERDQETLDRQTPAGEARIKLEPMAAPEMIGWEGLGQKAPGQLEYLYYGRSLDATHVLVVEVNLPPEGRHQALREAALSRLMKSVVLVAPPGAGPG
jgi:rhomboid protease GluP